MLAEALVAWPGYMERGGEKRREGSFEDAKLEVMLVPRAGNSTPLGRR